LIPKLQLLNWTSGKNVWARSITIIEIIEALIGNTISDVARKERLSYDLVLGALRRQIAATVNWEEIEQLEILGLDEIALRKGHRDFVVLVTTRQADGQLKLLGVLANRRLETVEEFLRTIPERLRPTVREVCTGMYDGYTSAVKHVLPGVHIVVDRFHVAKAYRWKSLWRCPQTGPHSITSGFSQLE
jgi:transposase